MRDAPHHRDPISAGPAPPGADAPSRASQRKSSAAWACAGFVVGALFWHTIGFWSFVQATLVPDGNSRRAEREQSASETRPIATASLRSPVRPTRTGTTTSSKLNEPPPAETIAPVIVPVILNPTEIAGCVMLTRKTGGGLAEATACAPLAAPLADGAGAVLADREPARAANMFWQAKVDVSPSQR
jgi:hypothetical protein